MVEEEPPEGRRTDRKPYLKRLALGLIGAGALLNLKGTSRARGAPAHIELGALEGVNNAGSNSTGIQSSTTDGRGTIFGKNTSSGPGVRGEDSSSYV